jgi:transposase
LADNSSKTKEGKVANNDNLSNPVWEKLKSFLQTQKHVYLGKDEDCRLFLEAIFWMAKSGAPWRFLPEKYGNWNTVYKRFARWEKQGVFKAMLEYFASNPDFKNMMLDSTITRAHPCAAGALKKTADKTPRPWDVLEGVSAQKFISWLKPKASRSSSF